VRNIVLFLLLFAVGRAANIAFQPFAERLQKLPSEAHQYWDFTGGEQGFAFASTEGLVVPGADGGWELRQPPKGSDVRAVLEMDNGLVVAGMGFCYVYDGIHWRDTGLVDEFIDGVSRGHSALLAGRKGIYQVEADGSGRSLRAFEDVENRHVFVVGGKVIVFAGAEGVWSWNGTELQKADADFPWVGKKRVIGIQELPNGTYLVSTSAGPAIIHDKTPERLFPAEVPGLLKKGYISSHIFGDTLVVSTFYGGLEGFSLSMGARVWSVDVEQLGGSVNFCKLYRDGLIVGTTNSVVVLPNPEKYSRYAMPAAKTTFATPWSKGVFLGTVNGLISVEGELPLASDLNLYSFMETRSGEAVGGDVGALWIGKDRLPVGGRMVHELSELGSGEWVLLQPHGVSLFARGQIPVLLNNLPPVPNTLAPLDDNRLLVGTSAGAVICSHSGEREGVFGNGLTRVFKLSDRVVAGDSRGNLYDGTGHVLGKTDLVELLDAVFHGSRTYLLGRAGDGRFWLLRMDEQQKIETLDVPLPRVPQHLIAGAEGLYVVGVDTMVRLSAVEAAPALNVLEAPVLLKLAEGRRTHGLVRVDAATDSVGLQLPVPRLAPWLDAKFSYRVEGGDWTSAAAGAIMPIQRLRYGESGVQVRAEWPNGGHVETLKVYRTFPWWARWWAFVVYGGLIVVFVVMAVQHRTRRIARKARQLEQALDVRTAELKKALKAREDFFSTMSHEIRNPLNGVVGLCDMLDEAEPGAIGNRERYLVRTLRGCAAQLRSTLDDVLDFSRIDRGDIQLREDVFDLKAAIEGAARSIDPKLDHVKIAMDSGALWLRGDSGKIRQIVCNLISNALKYGTPRAAHVDVAIDRTGEKTALCIAVRNTGTTIPPEEQEKIFEGFARGEEALRKRIPGSGIGLAVSRRMARAMNGDLLLKSENGLTEFALRLSLPIEAAPMVEKHADMDANRVSRAMAIEDEDYNRLVLGSMLKTLGYEVDWAVDGKSALELIKSGSYDIILTDFMLPDMTGLEVAAKLQELMREPKPPIIAVTAYSTKEKMEQARAVGIAGFVSKPVDLACLRAAILSAAPIPVASRRLVVSSGGRWDFDPMLRFPEGKRMLAEYAASLPEVWKTVVAHFDETGRPNEFASRAVHAFISRVLVVYAEDISAQLKLLEDAASEKRAEESKRLLTVISPMVEDLGKAAAARAIEY
jgi:signal transduction histidine kinase/CheY-like chemotaxis protein